jgi:Capsular polysaccharide synthesis protein
MSMAPRRPAKPANVPIPKRIWMYWEDAPARKRSGYLDLCFETVRAHAAGLDLIVVDERTVFDYLPEMHREAWELLPAINYRSDYARTRLVHRYGGVWIDYDSIIMRPIAELLAPLAEHETLGWGWEDQRRMYAGLFAARAGSRFVERWMEEQDRVLREQSDPRRWDWSALAQHIVQPLCREVRYHAWPIERISPVMYWEWRRFSSRIESPARVLAAQPYAVTLWNKAMGPWFGHLTRDDVFAADYLLSRLCRLSLGVTTLAEEERGLTRLAPLSWIRFSRFGRELEKQVRWHLTGMPRDQI